MIHAELGWLIIDMLRQALRTVCTPVILCSGDGRLAFPNQRERARRLGCDMLEKPFPLELLQEKVEAAVGPVLLERAVG